MSSARLLIVEDEVIVAEDLRIILKNLGYTVIGVAFDYDKALQLAEKHQPDLALIDVQLGDLRDGIQLAEELQTLWSIPAVFVTSNADQHTVQRAKLLRPAGYVVKPFEKRDLYAAVEMALANRGEELKANSGLEETPKETLFVKAGDRLERVQTETIQWLKADGNYTELHTNEQRFVVRGSVKEILLQLPDSFIRVHKSYAINLAFLNSILPDYVVLGEQQLPLSKTYRDPLMNRVKTLR